MKKTTLNMVFAFLFVGGVVSRAGLNATPILNASFESVSDPGQNWGYAIDDWYTSHLPDTQECFWEAGDSIGLIGDGLLWSGVADTDGKFYQDVGTVDDGVAYEISALIGSRWGTSFKTGTFSLYASSDTASATNGVPLSSFATLLSTINVTTDSGIFVSTNVYEVTVNLPTGTGHVGEVLWLEFGSAGGKDYFDRIAIVPSAAATLPAPAWTEPVTGSTGIVAFAYSDTLLGKAIDATGDAITYGLVDTGTWLSMHPGTGALSGTPDVLGENTFTVTATDGTGTNSTTLTIFVRTTLPPVWNEPVTSGDARIDVAYNGTLDGKATDPDPDGGTITYSLTDTGTWLNVATNGVLSGTPASTDEGTNTFTVVADDGVDTPSSATLTILVMPASQAGRHISVNFARNSNQIFSGGQPIGPLEIDSANWNNTNDRDSGEFKEGTMADLKDDTGASTTMDISWASSGTWWQGDGNADDAHRLSATYLDDGGSGLLITVTDIPYAEYRVYGLFSSGQVGNNAMVGRDFDVNSTWAYGDTAALDTAVNGTINGNMTRNGEFWTEIVPGSVVGNYWTVETSGSTLVVDGQGRNDVIRGSLAGIIIEEIAIPGPGAQVTDLSATGPTDDGLGMIISWTGENGKPYGVETNSNLIITSGWATWITGEQGNGGTITVTNTMDDDQIFYRVISENP